MSLFPRFNYFLDESGHFLLSATVFLIAQIAGLGMIQSLICFLAGFLIDIDHIFNVPIAKLLKLKYLPHLWKGSNKYVIKIFHGIDIGIIFGMINYALFQNSLFAILFTVSLFLHYLWDFVVYNTSWTSLFLSTRVINKFYVPNRTRFTNLIFSELPEERVS